MKKEISIVISAFNESKNISELGRQLSKLMTRLKKYNFEVIIVDNGSIDGTYDEILKLRKKDKRFKAIKLSRNFTPSGGQTAGLKYATGDAIVVMDADLQDPPEIVPLFIKKWEEGNHVVYGVIKNREGVSIFRKLVSPIFYRLIHLLSDPKIPINVTDFRLIDKKVLQVINNMPEHRRYLRGMIAWTGFKSVGVPFTRRPRFKKGGGGGGEEKFNLIKFANWTSKFIFDAIYSFSTIPLKIINLTGFLVAFTSFSVGFYFVIYYLINGTTHQGYVRGYTSTMLVILFMFGLLLIFLGIIGEYIIRIYDEVKKRPNFIIQEKKGVK